MSKHDGPHRYKRMNIGKYKEHWVMKCILPDCSHYVPMNSRLSCPLLWNQIGMCNRCGESFLLDRRALRMAEPCCNDCIKSKSITPKDVDKLKELEELLNRH